MTDISELYHFVKESNEIEGIRRDPTGAELRATEAFLHEEDLTVRHFVDLVKVYQPDALLRDRPGLDVRVGNHVAPRGGADIPKRLAAILFDVHHELLTVWGAHVKYEGLHPFTDGNGRSGRTFWLWQMLRRGERLAPGGFLHTFYYQTLAQVGR